MAPIVSLSELIDHEHKLKSRNSLRGPTAEEAKMSEQEREETRKREKMRYLLQMQFQQFFHQIVRNGTKYKYLLAVPNTLVNHAAIGTNAVMRTIFSDDVTPERMAYVHEFQTKVLREHSIGEPSLSELFYYFNRLHEPTQTLNGSTVAECFWLLEVANWAGCSTFDLTKHTQVMLYEHNGGLTLDFMRVLTRGNDGIARNDTTLMEAMYKQYLVLEKLLDRM